MKPPTNDFGVAVARLYRCGPEVLEQLLLQLADVWGGGFYADMLERMLHHIRGMGQDHD